MTYIPLYELLYGSSLARQRVVELFSGDSLNERWNENTVTGSPTFQMTDEIDQGFEILFNADEIGSITYNNTGRVFDFDDVAFIFIARRTAGTTNDLTQIGLSKDELSTDTDDRFTVTNSASLSFYNFLTENTSSTITDCSVVPDTVYHKFHGKIAGGIVTGHMDDSFETVHTTNLPDTGMQPIFRGLRNTTNFSARIKYYEAWNF